MLEIERHDNMFIVKQGYLDIMQMQEIRQLFLLFFFFLK